MPMWCTSSDKLESGSEIPEPHHKIVRIPPGESVVLNSAERAPYVLLVEVLHGDLSFDPSKRSNKEILKKIVVKENERKGASQDLIAFNGAPSPKIIPSRLPSQRSGGGDGTEVEIGLDTSNLSEGEITDLAMPTISTVAPASPLDDEEEIDLVEQVYGPEESLLARTIDISESIVLPPPPKNKELDMAAWSRSSSSPSSPIVDSDVASRHPTAPRLQRSLSSNQVERTSSGQDAHVLSLDEYSERMRTAAVMLAQLNASLVREPVLPASIQSPQLGSTDSPSIPRWLPGSSWLTITPPAPDTTPSRQDSNGAPYASANNVMRMKLQPSEAAAIRDRIMQEMLALEEERMQRMRENRVGDGILRLSNTQSMKTLEDESIIRKELSKADPSAVVMGESWAAKKVSQSAVCVHEYAYNSFCRAGYDKHHHTGI